MTHEILMYDPVPPPSPIISGHIKKLNNNSKWDISFSIKCNKAMLILAIQKYKYNLAVYNIIQRH